MYLYITKMKKKIILFIILLFIISCTARREYTPDFHTGTEGLTLEFLENAPPNELLYLTNNQFLIGIGLRNKGAENIEKGTIKITSNKNYIKIKGGIECKSKRNLDNGIECKLPRLKGKSFDFFEGEFFPLYLDAEVDRIFIKKEEEGLTEVLDTVKVEAEYKYGTTASVGICINDLERVFDIEKSCRAKTEVLSGQGGPVAVSEVVYSTVNIGDKNRLTITITFDDRGDRESEIKDETIKLEEISFSDYSTKTEEENKKIDCGVDEINITKNKREEYENKIECSANLTKEPAYLTPLIIRFSYDYLTEEKKDIRIRQKKEEFEVQDEPPAPIEEELDIGMFCGKKSPRYDDEIRTYSKSYSIDPCLVMAMISVESSFNPDTESIDGAIGLMQIMPATADTLKIDVGKLKDPKTNIEGGTRYFRDNYNDFRKNYKEKVATRMTIAAHNHGPKGVQNKVDKHGSDWFNHLPYETRNFVPCVEYCWKEFKEKSKCNKNNNQNCKNLVG